MRPAATFQSLVSCVIVPPDSRHADLPLDFIFQRVRQIAERIQILHFRLGAEFRRAAQPHADVRVAAQRPFLHVAVAHFRVFQHLLQRVQIRVRFGGRAQVRLGHDFDQRHAAAVEIDVAPLVRIRETFVQALARIVFHVQTRDADALLVAVHVRFRASLRSPAAIRTSKSGSPWASPDKNNFCARSASAPEFCSAMASERAWPISSALLFSTGSAPGRPRQTGQVFEFGGSPKRVEQPQNALVSVSSCACTSSPMTGSYFAITSGAIRETFLGRSTHRIAEL